MPVTAVNNDYAYLDRPTNDGSYFHSNASASTANNGAVNSTPESKSDGLFGADGFGFDDFLDIINPLQHIPVISTLYRELTGDKIESGARIIGGGIFGGGIGLATAVVNSAIEAETGKDIGDHIMEVVSSVTGIGDDADVAVGEKVTIAWNSERVGANKVAQSTEIPTITVSGANNVIEESNLLQRREKPRTGQVLQFKSGVDVSTSSIPTPQQLPMYVAAAYEDAAKTSASKPVSTERYLGQDYSYLDKPMDA